METFGIKRSSNYFNRHYVLFMKDDLWSVSYDWYIAKHLEISIELYGAKLRAFNGKYLDGCTYFRRKKDANEAILWLESILLARKIGDS